MLKRKRSHEAKAKKPTKRARRKSEPIQERERNHTPGYSHKVGLG